MTSDFQPARMEYLMRMWRSRTTSLKWLELNEEMTLTTRMDGVLPNNLSFLMRSLDVPGLL